LGLNVATFVIVAGPWQWTKGVAGNHNSRSKLMGSRLRLLS